MKSKSLLKFIVPATILLTVPATLLAEDKPVPPLAAEKIKHVVARIENRRLRASISFLIAGQSFTAAGNSALPLNKLEVVRALFQKYLNDLDEIDSTECSEKFQTALNDHVDAVQAALKYLRGLPANGPEQVFDILTRAAQKRPLMDSKADLHDEWITHLRDLRRSIPGVAKALQSQVKEEPPSERDTETIRMIRQMLKPYFALDF